MNVTPADEDERIGGPGARVADRYRLIREVGTGGMGTVYEAVNTWTDRRVAIKFMNRPVRNGARVTMPADLSERFMREAKATARVEHPNAVDVLDMGYDAEQEALYIVYEFLDGEALRALLERRGALGHAEAEAILTPVMEALAFAHRSGVVHRDLKPENIFLSRTVDGRTVPKVIDFGIARLTDEEGGLNLTRTGMTLGTARYMSPEQARGLSGVDARADVWAMGVVWFEALTGRTPYNGQNYNEILAKLVTEDPPRLRDVLADAPEALAAAVDGALRRDRDARHPTMERFLDALRGAPVAREERAAPPAPSAPPPPALSAAVPRASPSPLETATTDAAKAVSRPPRTRLALAGCAIGLVLGALLVASLRSSPAGRERPDRDVSPERTAPAPTPISTPTPGAPAQPAAGEPAPPVVASPPAPSNEAQDAGPRPVRAATRRAPTRHVAAPDTPTGAPAPPPETPRPPVTGANGAPVLEP